MAGKGAFIKRTFPVLHRSSSYVCGLFVVTVSARVSPMNGQLRAWWWARQGLDGSLSGCRAAEVLERTGWYRSVGGSGPYLTLFARAGLARENVDADMVSVLVHELPAARGCTYVVPACDYGIALRASRGHAEAAQMATAKKHLGVTDKEIYRLCEALTDALDGKVIDPRDLKGMIGGAIRGLGAEGKKRGVTTTLPLALGKLQSEGLIRRVPVNGRLDQQRYGYTLWQSPPRCDLTEEELHIELGRRYFRWIAPATTAQFAWWAGLGARAARAAVVALKLVPLADSDERLLSAEDKDALHAFKGDSGPRFALLGSIDTLCHLRRDVSGLLSDSDRQTEIRGNKSMVPANVLSDLPHHAIVERGQLVGYWDYDSERSRIAWRTFGQPQAELGAEVERTEAFIRDQLGDARAFSLDSPEGRASRIAALTAPSSG